MRLSNTTKEKGFKNYLIKVNVDRKQSDIRFNQERNVSPSLL
jgi:hypothetical protein